MKLDKALEVGDIIIRFGQVHQVYKIEEEIKSGKARRIIHYKHYYPNNRNETLLISIPEENIDRACIRKPLTKKELTNIFKKLKGQDLSEKVNINSAKAIVNSDDPWETFLMIYRLWVEKKEAAGKFPLSKREVLDKLMNRVIGETAYVFNLKKIEAKKKIKDILNDV